MRKGRHTKMFLLAVSVVGLLTGGAISLLLSSASTDVVFAAILVATIALAILANSLLKAVNDTQEVRNAAAMVPVPPSVSAHAATVIAKLARSESESEPQESEGD